MVRCPLRVNLELHRTVGVPMYVFRKGAWRPTKTGGKAKKDVNQDLPDLSAQKEARKRVLPNPPIQ